MNPKYGIFIIVACLICLASCSSSTKQKEISLAIPAEDSVQYDPNEVRFDDIKSLDVSTAAKSEQESQRSVISAGGDNSNITVMVDNFGNKVESREFRFHSKILYVNITTTADGRREIKVWGKNGEIKILPDSMSARALTASGDEIANAAGIYSGRQMRIINNPTVAAGSQTNASGESPAETVSPIQQSQVNETQLTEMSGPGQQVPADTQPKNVETQAAAPEKGNMRLAQKQNEENEN
jgi:hypothetical protein